MGFWNTLGEAAATFGGDDATAERFARQREHKQQLSERELESQTAQILGDVDALHERRAKLDPNSPTYQQDVKTIDQALHDARQVFTDLYHPAKNPGALSKLHGYIQGHLGRRKNAQQAPTTPAAVKKSLSDRIGEIDTAAYGQSTPENPYIKTRRQLKEANPNMTDEELNRATAIQAGIEAKPLSARPTWKLYISPDGKQRQYFDPADREGIPAGWMPVAPRAAQGNAPKVGSFGDFMIQAYGEKPTAEQYEEGKRLWAQSGAGTTVGEHVVMVPQVDGTIVPVTIVTTTTKSFGGAPNATPSPNVPKTPGEAKKIIAPHAGAVAKGAPVGGRLTAPQTSAEKKYNEAVGFQKEVDNILADQHKGTNVAIRQKRILVKLERLAAGRFTTQAVQYIQKAGWGNSIQQWVNNVNTGELPDAVWQQVVAAVKDYRDGALEELKSSGAPAPKDPMQDLLDEVNRKFVKKKPQ